MSALEWPLDRSRVIEASAGTGKTYTITTLVCRLVADAGLDIGSILVTTFTDAAAAELRERTRARMARVLAELRARQRGQTPRDSDALAASWARDSAKLGERCERLERAMRGIDGATIVTIHSFCRRVLAELPFESGAELDRALVEDDKALTQSVIADAFAAAVAPLSALEIVLAGDAASAEAVRQTARAALRYPDAPLHPAVQSGSGVAAVEAAVVRAERAIAALPLVATADRLKGGGVVKRKLLALAHAAQDAPLWVRCTEFQDSLRVIAKYDDDQVRKAVPVAHQAHAEDVVSVVRALREVLREVDGTIAGIAIGVRTVAARSARNSARERKRRERAMTFDDLVRDVHQALHGPRGPLLAKALRARYAVALVDEFQDTDWQQAEIFSRIFGGTEAPLFYIGDPKQSIYLFRGADIRAYLHATGAPEFEGRKSELQTNYRSDRALIGAVQAVMEVPPSSTLGGEPGGMPGIGIPRVNARDEDHRLVDAAGNAASGLRIVHAADDPPDRKGRVYLKAGSVMPRVAEAIRAELCSGLTLIEESPRGTRPLAPCDIAVIMRSNAEIALMQRALRRKGIPAIVHSRESVWASAEAEELMCVLRALAQSDSTAARRRAAATELAGMNSAQVRALAGPMQQAGEADDASGTRDASALSAWMVRLRRELENQGPVACVRRMLDEPLTQGEESARVRILRRVGGERTVTNLMHTAELLGGLWRRGVRSPGELAERIADARTEASSQPSDDQEMVQRLESDGSAVQLITIHKAKGLEWPVVWLPSYVRSAWETDPDPHKPYLTVVNNTRVLALGGPERDAAAQEYAEELNRENFRALYVALTRAQVRCNVVWASAHGQANAASPLGVLLHGRSASTFEDAAARAKQTLGNPQTIVSDMVALQTRAAADDLRGSIAIEPLPARGKARWRADVDGGELAPARVLRAAVPESARTSSFTGLTRDANEVHAAHDAVVAEVRTDDAERGEQAADVAHADAPLLSRDVLPAGPAYGDLVHRIMERGIGLVETADFAPLVERLCRAEGMARQAPALAAGLQSVCRQKLHANGATLCELTSGVRRVELSYMLPVGGGNPLSVGALARAFEQGGDVARRYSGHVKLLTAPDLRGHLVGFIDLICQHDGRWYVLDYKTNALGRELDAFAPAALTDAMIASHYVLQYHLYAVAVHRWLRTRVRDYSYERNFGGALYLFMRAMGQDRPAGSGVFADRPTERVMNALDAAITGESDAGNRTRGMEVAQ